MYFNYLSEPSISRTMTSSFLGLNKNTRIGDGEFSDMLNMSSDRLPLLAPRAVRYMVQKQISETVTETVPDADGNESQIEITEYKRLNGILGDVGFCAVWGNDFYYMGKKVDGITLIDGEKKLVAMGANILIFPDTVYYDTVNGNYGHIDTGEKTAGSFNMEKVKVNGILRSPGETFLLSVKWEGLAANVSGQKYITVLITQYKDHTSLPETVEYFGAALHGITIQFVRCDNELYYPYKAVKNGDVIESITEWRKLDITELRILDEDAPDVITGGKTNIWSGNTHIKYTHVDASAPYYSIEVSGKIFDCIDSFKTVSGKEYCKASYSWMLRTLPILDFVCVHENRLWGCHYGTQVNTYKSVNEIYCSALGDFKTWTLSGEIATLAGSPYAASVGEYGAFTGCISHRGYVLFFKDDVMYRVSGTKPANFQISKISTSGVQSGCEKSMEIIDEVLYYKSKSGVYAYDGSLPQKISSALGEGYYSDAVAGHLLSKYYITMVQNGERKLYVYDTRYGVWHAEDDIDVRFFTEYDGALYGGVGNDIVCVAGEAADIFTEAEREGDFEWSAESGDIGLSSPYQKYYHRLLIRMDMEMGARVKVELATDGGEWLIVSDFTTPDKRSFLMPVVTPRCDHMRFRISGRGDAKIYSVSFETETAGEKP